MGIIIGEFYNNVDDNIKPISESAMSSKERNSLDDDEFGIPSQRKYPLNDKKHVEQAIKMFNHVEKKYESELADNVLDAMEKYHISTDTVGDKNRLKKYIKEETIYEGLIWNDNTPKDIKELKEKIRDDLKKPENIKNLVDKVKDFANNYDFGSDEKKITYKVLNKNHVNIHGYTVKATTIQSLQISNTHTLIGTYKNYILTLTFIGVGGKIALSDIAINYDSNKCDIPKNVVFDVISMISPGVSKVRCTRYSIKIFAMSKYLDSGYPRIDHKYSKKYNIKKSFGLYIKISILKSVKEDSLIAAAMPRQDYNPNDVYIVNYMKNNVFDTIVCKDKMDSIFAFEDGKPKHIPLSEFMKTASNINAYKYIGECDFKYLVESSNSALEFYRKLVGDENAKLDSIPNDYRFNKVSSYADELNSIKECVINSAPKSGMINEVYCPIIPLINLNENYSSINYFRDIDGVFAQNIDTLNRSASYKSIEDIPKSTINLLKNI